MRRKTPKPDRSEEKENHPKIDWSEVGRILRPILEEGYHHWHTETYGTPPDRTPKTPMIH